MKRKVLWLLIFSLLSYSSAFAQDEADDEFFEDEEAIVDPADEFVPPPVPGDTSPRPRNFPRASGGPNMGGGYDNSGGGGGMSGSPDGAVVFRLVDPPAFKKPRPPTRIPLAIRQKVEEQLRKQEKLEK